MTDKVFAETTRIIAEKVEMPATELHADTLLETIDIQSLELAEVIFDLEDAFDIEIEMNTATAWNKLKTVGDVCDAVRELTNT